MDLTKVNHNFVVPLIGLLVEAIDLGKTECSSRILKALRILRPQMEAEYFQFSMWILIERGDYLEARRELSAHAEDTPQWHTLMCFCLAATDDPTWNSHADFVLAADDEPSKRLVRGLRGQGTELPATVETLVGTGLPVEMGARFGRV